MTLMIRLARLDAAVQASTPGEWRLQEAPRRAGGRPFSIEGGDRAHGFPFRVPVAYAALYVDHTQPQRVQRDVTRANARFIVAAHNEFPALKKEVLHLADLAHLAATELRALTSAPEATELAQRILEALSADRPSAG